jgi:hypothetical protein
VNAQLLFLIKKHSNLREKEREIVKIPSINYSEKAIFIAEQKHYQYVEF